MKTAKSYRFITLTTIILIASVSRIVPHSPNFVPIGAIALFGAAYFSNRILAFVIPFASMWLSDLVINNTTYHSANIWLFPDNFPWNYVAFLCIVPLGFYGLKKIKVTSLIGTNLLAAVVFFVISNFGVWIANPHYVQNVSGLVACYINAIPFFWNTLAGDLFYSAILFGAFELMQRRYSTLALSKV